MKAVKIMKIRRSSLIILDILLLAGLIWLLESAFGNAEMKGWVFRNMSQELIQKADSAEASEELEAFYAGVEDAGNGKTDIRDLMPRIYTETGLPMLNNTMRAPFDIRYYDAPGDASPSFVIPKGTLIYAEQNAALPESLPSGNYGYGFLSFPTRVKGWRLAVPFLQEGGYPQSKAYYVRLDDLVRLQRIRYRTDAGSEKSQFTFSEYIRGYSQQKRMPLSVGFYRTLLQIDMELARSDVPLVTADLYRPGLPLWVVCSLFALLIAGNVFLIIRRCRKKTERCKTAG